MQISGNLCDLSSHLQNLGHGRLTKVVRLRILDTTPSCAAFLSGFSLEAEAGRSTLLAATPCRSLRRVPALTLPGCTAGLPAESLCRLFPTLWYRIGCKAGKRDNGHAHDLDLFCMGESYTTILS